MGYRKFNAEKLFTGHEMLDENFVLITEEDGTIENIIPLQEAGSDIEKYDGIISPGFINCHCHLELSHMKNVIPEKTGMVDFLLKVMKERNANAEQIQQSIKNAEEEMLRSGIVAVGDICNTTDTIARKRERNLYYHNFIEATGFVEATADARFESSKETFKQFAAIYSLPVESNSIVPHAPYSVSEKLFQLIANFPGNNLLTIHNQESEEENEFLYSGTGDFLRLFQGLGIDTSFFQPKKKRSPETYLPYFYPNQSLILVHDVMTNEKDLQMMFDDRSSLVGGQKPANKHRSTNNTFFCLCPNANEYITGKLPDVDLFIRKNCSIVIGTDSLASNHQLNILEELKNLQRNFPHLETKLLLQWATINGAYALQLDSSIGSFDKGKQPGIVWIENIQEEKFTPESRSRRIL